MRRKEEGREEKIKEKENINPGCLTNFFLLFFSLQMDK